MTRIWKKVVILQPKSQDSTKLNDASVAQLVEHLTLNQGVQGSTPCGSTRKSHQFGGFFVFSAFPSPWYRPFPYFCPIKS